MNNLDYSIYFIVMLEEMALSFMLGLRKTWMITYVCNFMNVPARMWQDADPETKVEFQKMVIESGITFDFKTEKFGTDGLSIFYRLKDTIKDASEYDESFYGDPTGNTKV